MMGMLFSTRFLKTIQPRILAIGIIGAACAMFSGCSTSQKTTTNRVEQTQANAATISSLRSWLTARSIMARNMSVEGDITLDQNGASNSASFSMKSKRLADPQQTDAGGTITRIDSLSVEVSGPFGIKLAKFLASPQKYQFYDILHGDPMTGATDAHSLESLTHLRGVSLSAMNDIIYGIAGSDLKSSDSLQFFSNGNKHRLIVQKINARITEQIVFEGELPNDSSGGNLSLVEFIRWNSLIDPMSTSQKPDVIVKFQSPTVVNGVSIPQHIDAVAGENKLTLDYNKIEVNSRSIIVRIKMPSQ
jgi:hypothetical protein